MSLDLNNVREFTLDTEEEIRKRWLKISDMVQDICYFTREDSKQAEKYLSLYERLEALRSDLLCQPLMDNRKNVLIQGSDALRKFCDEIGESYAELTCGNGPLDECAEFKELYSGGVGEIMAYCKETYERSTVDELPRIFVDEEREFRQQVKTLVDTKKREDAKRERDTRKAQTDAEKLRRDRDVKKQELDALVEERNMQEKEATLARNRIALRMAKDKFAGKLRELKIGDDDLNDF